MERVTIKHFGNIQEVTLDLKKFNVIIGPQSSGKSTIAKIVSHCYWLEKQFVINLGEYQVQLNQFWAELSIFHNMSGYLTKDSYIAYESDYLKFCGQRDGFTCEMKDGFLEKYIRSKVSYIPSDRNFVAMPRLEKFQLPDISLRSFIFDWYDARKYYPQNNTLNILDLDMSYYLREGIHGNEDRLVGGKNNAYDILLSQASSGLQSIVPLLVTLEYYAKDFFERSDVELSYDDRELNRFLEEKIQSDEVRQNIMAPHFTRFILEEPEQNLFPTTQKELIYQLIRMQKAAEYGHSFMITTHSPYILATFNLLLFATTVAEESEELKTQIDQKLRDLSLSLKDFGAYYLDTKDGKVELVDLIDEETGMISQNELDTVSEEIALDFNKIYSMYAKLM